MSTYTPIASQTLSTSAPSVTFSSIPQGYTDLVLISNLGAADANTYIKVTVGNGSADTATNYSYTELYGGNGTGSQRQSTKAFIGTPWAFGNEGSNVISTDAIFNFMNYSNTTTYKSVLLRTNTRGASNPGLSQEVALWRSTSAINIIKLDLSSGNFSTGSTFTLYGIQVGQAAQKAQGGNIVTTDGTYVYHTFTSSGAFIPSEALTVDYLVVAGGGGGGATPGGGGGGGGYRTSIGGSALSVTAKPYPVIVGAGGVAGAAVTGNSFITWLAFGTRYGPIS